MNKGTARLANCTVVDVIHYRWQWNQNGPIIYVRFIEFPLLD